MSDSASRLKSRFLISIFRLLRLSNCVFLTYDITSKETFTSLLSRVRRIKEVVHREVRMFLVGKKCDLEAKREITKEEALAFACEHKIHKVFETSAKTGHNV